MSEMSSSKGIRLRHTGFTLVEILIVIVAMAIIAGVVLPEFGSAVEDANRSAMLQNLHMLTEAIERYRIDHNGVPPDDLTGDSLQQLFLSTDLFGNLGSGPYGPYILADEMPVNPINHSNKVVQGFTPPILALDGAAGWVYDPATGQIWAAEN